MAPAIDDSDKRDRKLDVRASQTEKDLIRQLADEDGLSLSAWTPPDPEPQRSTP